MSEVRVAQRDERYVHVGRFPRLGSVCALLVFKLGLEAGKEWGKWERKTYKFRITKLAQRLSFKFGILRRRVSVASLP